MTWTAERIEDLKRLWADGQSASEIANQLGGVSRNAVIGKIHRLNLSGKAKPAPAKKERKPKPKRLSKARPSSVFRNGPSPKPKKPLPWSEPIELQSLRVPLLELTDSMCRWPSGDPKGSDFGFCGHRKHRGLPYCEYHARRAYQPPTERRRSAA